jgi:peptidoglycan hydrolase-like protein with peptidoglycan-binding domain
MSELAVGTIALAAVALITFFGVRTSPPGASLPTASRSSEITASVVAAAPVPAAAPAPAPQPPPVEPERAPPVVSDNTGAAVPPVRPGFPPPPEPDRPVAAVAPSLDRAIEYSPAPLTTTNPLGSDGAAAARAEVPSRSRPADPMRAQPPIQLPIQQPSQPTETMAARTEAERDLVNRLDVISIQTKLRELGYYPGESDGVWGPGARRALRDFKIMNGLQENEQWDRETEDRLWSGRGVAAGSTFIGIWARDAAECRNRTGEDERIRIDARGAESAGTKCDFRSVTLEAAGRWQIRALCSADRDLWTANISLKLTGSNLRWSSERGAETYLRCGRVSVISSR